MIKTLLIFILLFSVDVFSQNHNSHKVLNKKIQGMKFSFDVIDKENKFDKINVEYFVVENQRELDTAVRYIKNKKKELNRKFDSADLGLLENTSKYFGDQKENELMTPSNIQKIMEIDPSINQISIPKEALSLRGRKPSSFDYQAKGKWYSKKGRLVLSLLRGSFNGAVAYLGFSAMDMPPEAAIFLASEFSLLSGYLMWHNDTLSDIIGTTRIEREVLKKGLQKKFPHLDHDENKLIKGLLAVERNQKLNFIYSHTKWLLTDAAYLALIMAGQWTLNSLDFIRTYLPFKTAFEMVGTTALKGLVGQGLFDVGTAVLYSERVDVVRKLYNLLDLEKEISLKSFMSELKFISKDDKLYDFDAVEIYLKNKIAGKKYSKKEIIKFFSDYSFDERSLNFKKLLESKFSDEILVEDAIRILAIGDSKNNLIKDDYESLYETLNKASKNGIISRKKASQLVLNHKNALELIRGGIAFVGSMAWVGAAVSNMMGLNIGDVAFASLAIAGGAQMGIKWVNKKKNIKGCNLFLKNLGLSY